MDMLLRAPHLQSNGELKCFRYLYTKRQELITAVKEFFFLYEPTLQEEDIPRCSSQPMLPNAPNQVLRVMIGRAVDPTDPSEDPRGVWGIMRQIGMRPGAPSRLQYLEMGKPTVNWIDGISSTNSRMVALESFTKLVLSSPYFVEGSLGKR